jgi:hypothetical protein
MRNVRAAEPILCARTTRDLSNRIDHINRVGVVFSQSVADNEMYSLISTKPVK